MKVYLIYEIRNDNDIQDDIFGIVDNEEQAIQKVEELEIKYNWYFSYEEFELNNVRSD